MSVESVESQLDLPVVEIVSGQAVEFPRLDLDDLMKWANTLRARRMLDADKRIQADEKVSAFERQRLLQIAADEGIQLGLLLGKSYEPDGIRTVLMTSLKKAKRAEADALAVLKLIHFRRQQAMVQEILSPPPPPPKPEPKAPGDEGFTEPETGDSAAP